MVFETLVDDNSVSFGVFITPIIELSLKGNNGFVIII